MVKRSPSSSGSRRSDYAENITREFENKRDVFVSFTNDLEGIIRKLLEHHKIELAGLEVRTKSIESFREKVARPEKNGKYARCEEVTDLSGMRLICYLQEEALAVRGIVEKYFVVDEENSKFRKDFLAADRLGYRADHLVVSLSQDRLKLAELGRYKAFKAEIQIKTVLEHAWAAIDWKIRYKGKVGIPEPVLRKLYRISAFLEGADEDFSRVKVEADSIQQGYSKQIRSGDLAIAIDRESIIAFLNESQNLKKIVESARKVGFKVAPPLLQRHTSLDGLINTITAVGIKDIASLERNLEGKIDGAQSILDEFRTMLKAEEPAESTRFDILTKTTLLRLFLVASASAAKARRALEVAPLAARVTSVLTSMSSGRPKRNAS